MYDAICPNLSGRPFISPSVLSIASAVFFALSSDALLRRALVLRAASLAEGGAPHRLGGERHRARRERGEASEATEPRRRRRVRSLCVWSLGLVVRHSGGILPRARAARDP